MMSAQSNANKDRLIIAKRNRQLQLERWDHCEKEHKKSVAKDPQKTCSRNIQFSKEVILLEAISRNDIKEVTELLKQGVNPNSVTIDGLTGLHQCCIDDYLEMGTLLLKYKANVNAVDTEMWTPLHAAATCGNIDMCQLLIDFGADFLAINADGNMPYDICEGSETLVVIESEMSKRSITQEQIDEARLLPERNMLSVVTAMIRSRENLDELDSQGAAPLHISCSLGFNEVVQTLLEARANPSLLDREGWQPIHIAACWNYVEIVENLVAFGANIDDCNINGDSVFEICEPQFKDKLLYIKNNVETIRKNFDFSRLPQTKSFRKSRGSSIRRSTVRHKTMMSRKEPKEEFLTMNQQPPQIPTDANNEEDNSDIDSFVLVDTKAKSAKTVTQIEQITSPAVGKPVAPVAVSEDVPELIAKPPSVRTSSNKTKKATRAPTGVTSADPDSQSSNHSRSNNHSEPIPPPHVLKVQDVQLEALAVQPPPVNNNSVITANSPRSIYCSTTESWGVTSSKKCKRRRCCVIL